MQLPAGDEGRRAGKLTLNEALAGEGGRQRSLAAMKRKQERARQKAMGMNVKAEKQVRDVQLPETIIVSELANRMAERAADVVKSLMKMGMMVTMNQTIDADTAELVAFAKERIGSVKAPKQVHVWPDLPRSTVGKVLKTTIRERLLGG